MAKRPKTPMLVERCHVAGCTENAAYGFREFIDTANSDSAGRVREFIMGDKPNWCLKHDAEKRREYANTNGRFVGPL